MTDKETERVDVDFESHPPIEEDLDGIAGLLRQTLLQFVDCHSLAKYLIHLKDVTQVLAQQGLDEESTSEDDEPDNNIYGVTSITDLPLIGNDQQPELDVRKQILNFLKEKCPRLGEINSEKAKMAMLVNERYINLPPQIALPTLKIITQHLDSARYSHLVLISKILLRSRQVDTTIQSKKNKSSGSTSAQKVEAEPIVFINPEEEIICEHSEYHVDIDVSSYCDDNATWSFGSDVKYIPHRRIVIINYEKWPIILSELEKELK